MANTGEDRETAARAVLEAMEGAFPGHALLVDESWVPEWKAGEWEPDAESLAWLRSRPESVKKLMMRFPPSCLVQANRGLGCPAPATTGIVSSYIEPDDEHPDGMLSVRQNPDHDHRAECRPEWLTVVGYWRGLTPKRLKEHLDDGSGVNP